MHKTCKTLLTAALSVCGVFGYVSHAAAYDDGVKIQINDQLIRFPDAQPFVDANSRTQVPVRFVSEKMGYHVDWNEEGNEVKVTIHNQDKSIVLQTGDNHAFVNGKPLSLDTKAMLVEDRTFVPLRFVTETFGTNIQWDDQDSVAIIDADGRYHGSAWQVPQTSNLIATAKQYLGVPYVWGGTTPDGFDCSGFTKYVFGQNGINLPRTSAEMFETGSAVSNPQPGDLVFFTTDGSGLVSHVGIYLGDNRFISATSSHGVHIDSLWSQYWGARYLGARHI